MLLTVTHIRNKTVNYSTLNDIGNGNFILSTQEIFVPLPINIEIICSGLSKTLITINRIISADDKVFKYGVTIYDK